MTITRLTRTGQQGNSMDSKEYYMQCAIDLAENGIKQNEGGPFGAIIVKNGKIVGKGNNRVISTNDPTAHAEIVAIRDACTNLESFDLSGCEIYTSCEPCPMCLSAIYWANISKIYYGNTRKDAANIGFRDDFLFEEIKKIIENRKIPTENLLREQTIKTFKSWQQKKDKTRY